MRAIIENKIVHSDKSSDYIVLNQIIVAKWMRISFSL